MYYLVVVLCSLSFFVQPTGAHPAIHANTSQLEIEHVYVVQTYAKRSSSPPLREMVSPNRAGPNILETIERVLYNGPNAYSREN